MGVDRLNHICYNMYILERRLNNMTKTYRERIDEVSECCGRNDYLSIKQYDVYGMLDEIERRINDIADLIQNYEIKQAYNELQQLGKEMY